MQAYQRRALGYVVIGLIIALITSLTAVAPHLKPSFRFGGVDARIGADHAQH